MEPILKILDPYIKPDTRILELGCGTGRLVNAMVKKYPEQRTIVAADIFSIPGQIDPKVKFVKQDLENINIEGTFDLIIMNQVLEHIKNALSLMEKVKSNLSPTGTIYLAVPNRKGFHNNAKVWNKGDGPHYHLWDKESLEFSLDKIGLRARFIHLYEAPTKGGVWRYLPTILRIQNPNLICLIQHA